MRGKKSVRHILITILLVLRVRSEGCEAVEAGPSKMASPPDFSTNHNNARNVHYEGTANWFFQGEIFKEWRTTPSLLWVHGKRRFLPSVALHLTNLYLDSGLWKEYYVVCKFSSLIPQTG